jgi:F0F1-type ATP synthase assembly protein I
MVPITAASSLERTDTRANLPGMITERHHEADALSFADLRQRLKSGTRVIIVEGRQRTVIGKVVEVSGDSITVRAPDNSSSAVLPGQGTAWHLRTDSLINGTLIGAAFGAVISVANYQNGVGAGAISGVPIWALIGVLTDRFRTSGAHRGETCGRFVSVGSRS